MAINIRNKRVEKEPSPELTEPVAEEPKPKKAKTKKRYVRKKKSFGDSE